METISICSKKYHLFTVLVSFCWRLCEIRVFLSQFCLSNITRQCAYTSGEVDDFNKHCWAL